MAVTWFRGGGEALRLTAGAGILLATFALLPVVSGKPFNKYIPKLLQFFYINFNDDIPMSKDLDCFENRTHLLYV